MEKTDPIKCGEDGEEVEPLYTAGSDKKWNSHFRKQFDCFLKY